MLVTVIDDFRLQLRKGLPNEENTGGGTKSNQGELL